MKSKLFMLFLMLAVAMAMTTSVALAKDDAAKKDIEAIGESAAVYQISGDQLSADQENQLAAIVRQEDSMQAATTWDSSGYRWVGIEKPKSGAVYYRGGKRTEKMKTSVVVKDTWAHYYTVPVYGIFDSDGDVVKAVTGNATVDVNSSNRYTGKIKLGDIDRGKYHLYVFAWPAYNDGTLLGDVSNFDIPYAKVKFTLKKLKAPKGLKVKTGKKKVIIRYKKAAGAKQYRIYRSTSKYGTYKRIATTSSTKYTDRKVKKGKKYYYKVRSYRPNYKVQSGFSVTKRSKRVR